MAKLIITAKCSDQCACQLVNDKGLQVAESDSYVPKGITIGGVDDDGDYIDIEIDIKTGQILNWKSLTQAQVVKALQKA